MPFRPNKASDGNSTDKDEEKKNLINKLSELFNNPEAIHELDTQKYSDLTKNSEEREGESSKILFRKFAEQGRYALAINHKYVYEEDVYQTWTCLLVDMHLDKDIEISMVYEEDKQEASFPITLGNVTEMPTPTLRLLPPIDDREPPEIPVDATELVLDSEPEDLEHFLVRSIESEMENLTSSEVYYRNALVDFQATLSVF